MGNQSEFSNENTLIYVVRNKTKVVCRKGNDL